MERKCNSEEITGIIPLLLELGYINSREAEHRHHTSEYCHTFAHMLSNPHHFAAILPLYLHSPSPFSHPCCKHKVRREDSSNHHLHSCNETLNRRTHRLGCKGLKQSHGDQAAGKRRPSAVMATSAWLRARYRSSPLPALVPCPRPWPCVPSLGLIPDRASECKAVINIPTS